MKKQSLLFTGPRQIAMQEEVLPIPAEGQVRVQSIASAVSPGTEMLIYRGEFPRGLPTDDTIAALAGKLDYPLKYGYATVGRVVDTGQAVDAGWQGRLVFSFNPHETGFLARCEDLFPIPADILAEDALFLPNMETAVNFLLDGRPLVGERVVVFGQGIVGLLTTALLARLPLARLVTLDSFRLRRETSLSLGANAVFDPGAPDGMQAVRQILSEDGRYPGADLVYELSGSPAALDQAIAVTGFNGRIVIGSWYGQKRASLDLGGSFHRSRIQLISSQVSTMTPELSGRWTKARRLGVAWDMLRRVQPARFVTHRIPFTEADQAYTLLDEHPEQAIQVVLTHPSE